MKSIFTAVAIAAIFLCSNVFAYAEKAEALYQKLDLDNLGLDYHAFLEAVERFDSIKQIHPLRADILSIADFTQSSREKRFYIMDLAQEKMLFHTWVAHGKNTGDEYAEKFSNTPNSNQTSLGAYLTAETYEGGNGYSLRLDGLDRGKNDKARERPIVVHGAWYVSQKQIDEFGRIGRSYGCPAVEQPLAQPVIDTIKGGTVLYHYYRR